MTELYDIKGCGNHGCQVSPPEGVGTNGACRCYKDPLKMQRVLHNYRILAAPERAEEVEQCKALAIVVNEGIDEHWESLHPEIVAEAKRIVQPTGGET